MVPIIFNSSEPMLKLRVMTTKDSFDKTLGLLQQAGVLDIEESSELKAMDRAEIGRKRNEISEYMGQLDAILAYAPAGARVALDEQFEVICTGRLEEIRKEIDQVRPFFDNLRTIILKYSENIEQLKRLKISLLPFKDRQDIALKDLNFSGEYLFSSLASLPIEGCASAFEKIKPFLLESHQETAENRQLVYLISQNEHRAFIETTIRQAGGELVNIPDSVLTVPVYLGTLENQVNEVIDKQNSTINELKANLEGKLERLVMLREALKAESESLSVLEKATQAKYVSIIEGWIPESKLDWLTAELKDKINSIYIDSRGPSPEENPPTRYKNPKPMKPFQVIVNLFGTPGYREWDPTPIISYSFAIFFGLMGADVIYAIGVILLGRFLLPKFVDDPQTEGFKLFQRLIYTCGGVSLVIGLLTGSYLGDIYRMFGITSLAIVPAISDLLSNPLNFIVMSILIGYVHVNIAHIISFIKAIKNRDKIIILDKIGLFLLQLGLPTILHGILKINFPFFTPELYSILLYVMYAGIVLIFASFWMQRPGLGLILGLFDVIGLMGDVLSYARIAGVGLATYYLAFSFNLMADVFRGLFSGFIPGILGAVIGSVVAILILLFGHSLNVILAGISPFVHALRLCFVEFLLKFFDGSGREYAPFKLKKRKLVSVNK